MHTKSHVLTKVPIHHQLSMFHYTNANLGSHSHPEYWSNNSNERYQTMASIQQNICRYLPKFYIWNTGFVRSSHLWKGYPSIDLVLVYHDIPLVYYFLVHWSKNKVRWDRHVCKETMYSFSFYSDCIWSRGMHLEPHIWIHELI